MTDTSKRIVYVDVICPVYNAEETLSETVYSVIQQTVPQHLLFSSPDFGNQHQYYIDGYGRHDLSNIHIDVAICCYDDASTDASLSILEKMQRDKFPCSSSSSRIDSSNDGGRGNTRITTQMFIGSSTYYNETKTIINRGAPFARNQAIHLRSSSLSSSPDCFDMDVYFLCFLDSDDIMHPHRIAEQVSVLLYLSPIERHLTLLGCTFNRIPEDSTWHYTQWANTLSDERLVLERFREVTIIQPTWMMTRHRFISLGGYVQDIPPEWNLEENSSLSSTASKESYKLIHPYHDNTHTLRLAEDLRFFHAHLYSYQDISGENYGDKQHSNKYPIHEGLLKLVRTKQPLLTYRHRVGLSQSSSTPRKLLLRLRLKAFEDSILRRQKKDWLSNEGFVIWGAGRDGKDFFKCLSDDLKPFVRCFVDIDEKKFGFYQYPQNKISIPVVHFCHLIRNDDTRNQFLLGQIPREYEKLMPEIHQRDDSFQVEENHTHCMVEVPFFGKISKRRPEDYAESSDVGIKATSLQAKKSKVQGTRFNESHNLSLSETLLRSLTNLPVVVCVSMYRSNFALENNVKLIGRTEGVNLWHFC